MPLEGFVSEIFETIRNGLHSKEFTIEDQEYLLRMTRQMRKEMQDES